MADEVNVPVAFCSNCSEEVPVYLAEFEISGSMMEIVFCPVCESIISMEDTKITYYSPEDVEKVTGWKAQLDAESNDTTRRD